MVVQPSEFNTSSIVVRISDKASFTDLSDFNNKMNSAISRANNGTPHPAGNFTITAQPAQTGGFTGKELMGENFGIKPGEQIFKDAFKDSGFSEVSSLPAPARNPCLRRRGCGVYNCQGRHQPRPRGS